MKHFSHIRAKIQICTGIANYRFVFTKDIGNTNKYRFIWLWYIESQDTWFISDENEPLIRAVHVTSGVITFDDTLTYPDTTLSIADRTADAKAVGDALQAAYKKLNSNTSLGFYCIEDVTIVTNGVAKTYPANSNVEISFIEGDT